MNVTIDLPEIEGFEFTGEYREPDIGEYVTWGNFSSVECWGEITRDIRSVFILRKKRWRAEKGCSYYRVKINGFGPYVDRGIDDRAMEHNAYYNSGNYFKSEEAQAMGDKIKKLLKEEG